MANRTMEVAPRYVVGSLPYRIQRSTRLGRSMFHVRAIAAPELSPQEAGTADASNQLEALKKMSKIVADSGEINQIKKYKPIDSTTNPRSQNINTSCPVSPDLQRQQMGVLTISGREVYVIVDAIAVEDGPSNEVDRPYARIADVLSVNVGLELLEIVPGRVSTEVDAHLSYDTQKTVDKALRLIDLYAKKGFDIGSKRIYIKIASTWEGIRACEILQKQDIDTNMTLLFSFAQAGACADAGAALISPFVGRIMDWYKKKEGHDFAPHEDPGVKSVQKIYKYYKEHKYKTIVMAASFRNVGEIRELAGCDNITIAPKLLGELEDNTEPLPRKLWPEMGGCDESRIDFSGSHFETFKKLHGEDQMAVDKLKEGIESFAKDQEALEKLIGELKDHV